MKVTLLSVYLLLSKMTTINCLNVSWSPVLLGSALVLGTWAKMKRSISPRFLVIWDSADAQLGLSKWLIFMNQSQMEGVTTYISPVVMMLQLTSKHAQVRSRVARIVRTL